VADCYEYGNETFASVKGREFLDQLGLPSACEEGQVMLTSYVSTD
jgi:hypothetical protein